jgi:hypothetical protein
MDAGTAKKANGGHCTAMTAIPPTAQRVTRTRVALMILIFSLGCGGLYRLPMGAP